MAEKDKKIDEFALAEKLLYDTASKKYQLVLQTAAEIKDLKKKEATRTLSNPKLLELALKNILSDNKTDNTGHKTKEK